MMKQEDAKTLIHAAMRKEGIKLAWVSKRDIERAITELVRLNRDTPQHKIDRLLREARRVK